MMGLPPSPKHVGNFSKEDAHYDFPRRQSRHRGRAFKFALGHTQFPSLSVRPTILALAIAFGSPARGSAPASISTRITSSSRLNRETTIDACPRSISLFESGLHTPRASKACCL